MLLHSNFKLSLMIRIILLMILHSTNTPRLASFASSPFLFYPLFQGSSRARPNGGWLALEVVARPVSLQESGLAVPDDAASGKQMLADRQPHLSFNCPSKTGWRASLCVSVVSSDSRAGSKRFNTVQVLLAEIHQVHHGE